MGGKKKNKEEKVVVAEFRVSMHCNACERSVAKAISKIKGVEEFMTDMTNNKVVITGRINPQKVLKKLKKKTGKRVEILDKEDGNGDEQNGDLALEECKQQIIDSWMVEQFEDSELHMMFSDENANACSIM